MMKFIYLSENLVQKVDDSNSEIELLETEERFFKKVGNIKKIEQIHSKTLFSPLNQSNI